MKKIIDQINDFLGEDAHLVIENNKYLKINIKSVTTGSQRTMDIALPTIVGESSTGPLLRS